MDDLMTIKGIVTHILTECREARDSDEKLYIEVVRILNPHVLKFEFPTVFLNFKELGLPSFESVSRARRKAVERHPYLAGCEAVEGGRWSREKEFREFAREC